MVPNEPQIRSLTWAAGETSNSEFIITKDNAPRRLALTATCFFFSETEPRRLLICNPHPDSWNTWMLPYGGMSTELREGTIAAGMKERDVEEVTRRESLSQPKAESLVAGMLEMGGVRKDTLVSKFADIYEIKFSASTGIWTLYWFLYYFGFVSEATPHALSRWVTVGENGQMTKRLRESIDREILPIQPNVFRALEMLDAIPNFPALK